MSRYTELDTAKLQTVSITERFNKVSVSQFGRVQSVADAAKWLDTFPQLLAAENLRKLVSAMRSFFK